KEISSYDLVPGDVMLLQAGDLLSCDCVLLHGALVMNEAALTGEATPVQKSGFLDEQGRISSRPADIANTSYLFAGTRVFAGSGRCLVLAVGVGTSRGQLIRTMLCDGEKKFPFEEEMSTFFFWILAIGCPFVLVCLVGKIGVSPAASILLITQVLTTMNNLISPFLPVSLSNTYMSAARRLRQKNLLCLEAKKIPRAGRLRTFCFDKTGTLTWPDMHFRGVCLFQQQ
ncbi:unnamed protein product, partial [Amoebophrya sp. A25]